MNEIIDRWRIEEGKNLYIARNIALICVHCFLLFYFFKKKHEKQNLFSRSLNLKTKRNFKFFFLCRFFLCSVHLEETTKSLEELEALHVEVLVKIFNFLPRSGLLRRIKCLVQFSWFAKNAKISAKISLWFLINIYASMVKTWRNGDIKKQSK